MSLAALDQKFCILDELPDALYATIITHTHGELLTRVEGILQWRTALLEGHLPEEKDLIWPESTLRRSILQRLEVLEIVRYCKDQVELTDNILKDICEGISSAEEYYKHKPGGFVDKLAQQQNIRDRESPFDDLDGLADHVADHETSSGSGQNDSSSDHNSGQQNSSTNIAYQAQEGAGSDAILQPENHDVSESDQLEVTATTDQDTTEIFENNVETIQFGGFDEGGEHVSDYLEHRWSELSENWNELADTFSELSGLLGRGWDLTQGVIASQGWRDIIRYRKLIKQIPELKALVKTLGRLKAISGDGKTESVSEKIFNPIKRMVKDEDETMTLRAVMETGGIDRSDELSRMLPSELALLGHPKLNILWHAKRAERMLMTYSYSGLMPETVEVEDELEQDGPPEENKSSQGHGPIIVCLDTSGSMHGEPERIAKALVLEALRIAWTEKRPCYVYTFGGPEKILEHELDLTQGGLGKLLDFLQMSFHGGTDVTKPLLKALEKQYSESWERADILLISDGRFPAQTDVFSRIKKMKKKQELRLHGLLLGDWKGAAIEQLCEPLHRFNDWDDLLNGIVD